MKWEELQRYLKGRLFLIGINFVNRNEELIEQYQTHGRVKELTNERMLRFNRKDGTIIQMPYFTNHLFTVVGVFTNHLFAVVGVFTNHFAIETKYGLNQISQQLS